MTPKDIEQIVSQISDLRFQLLIRIQFHLELETIDSFFRLKKSNLENFQIKSKGAEKMLHGYWNLFETDQESAFLLEMETVQTAISKMENIIEKIQLDNKKIKWSEIRKSVKSE